MQTQKHFQLTRLRSLTNSATSRSCGCCAGPKHGTEHVMIKIYTLLCMARRRGRGSSTSWKANENWWLTQSWSWVTFSKPNPTQPTKVFTRPNPTHHRHLLWHIRLYRKLYTTTVTRHRQVHSSQL